MKKLFLIKMIAASYFCLLGCEETSIMTPNSEDLYGAIVFINHRDCVGCKDLNLFEVESFSEISGIEIATCINEGSNENLFLLEVANITYKQDEETCAIINKASIEQNSSKCMDAGSMLIEAEWDVSPQVTLNYDKDIQDYSTAFIPANVLKDPHANMDINITLAGGTDIDSFTMTARSSEPIQLLSPIVENDKIDHIRTDQSLEVIWSGGVTESVVIYILSEWVTSTNEFEILACHVKNDGVFTIPVQSIQSIRWGQIAQLEIVDTMKIPLDMAGLKNASLLLGSTSSTYIHYNPNAELLPPEVNSQIETELVGIPCNSDTECGDGLCIEVIKSTNIKICSIPFCETHDDCPIGSVCFSSEQAAMSNMAFSSYCTKKCQVDSDCNDDYPEVCFEQNGMKSCVNATF